MFSTQFTAVNFLVYIHTLTFYLYYYISMPTSSDILFCIIFILYLNVIILSQIWQ